jgi:hypothetical protein
MLDRYTLADAEAKRTTLVTTGDARVPDVACGGERLVSAWYQRSGSTWRVQLRARGVHDSPGDSLPPFAADLGTGDWTRGLAVAATDTRAYVAWFRDGELRIRRYRIGSGAKHQLTYLDTTTFAMSNATYIRISAGGDRAVVTYLRNDGVRTRATTDAGASWGSQRTVLAGAECQLVYPDSVAIRGATVVVSVARAAIVGGNSTVYRSVDSGVSWSEVSNAVRFGGRSVVGLSAPSGTTRIVQAWDQAFDPNEPQRVRFRRAI